MVQSHTNQFQTVNALANRLRMIQLDFAQEPAEQRQDFLADELTRALQQVPSSERAAYLQQLQDQFPSWDSKVDVGDASSLKSAIDEKELADASFLVSRLAEIAPTLSDREKQVVQDRLVSCGLAASAPKLEWRDDASEELVKHLEVKSADELDPARALSTIDQLVACVTRLDKLAHKTWQEIAPRQKLKEQGRLNRDLSRYFAGDADVSREQVGEHLERLRGLVAAMIFAIKTAPREWCHRYLETHSPTAIEGLVESEGVGFLGKKEAKCWEKYQQLAKDQDQVVMSQEILQVVAEFANRILEGGRT